MEGIIKGTTCDVELCDDYVKKYPRTISAKTLYERQQEAIELMQKHYYDKVDAVIPLVKIELSGDEKYLKQDRVEGKPLGKLTDEEIDNLSSETKIALRHLLSCNETLRSESNTKNFIDLFGYDESLNCFLKVWRTLNVRFSTNIIITNSNEVKLIDSDLYYREERSWTKRLASKTLTPLMFQYIAKFKKRLESTYSDQQVS